MVKERFTESVDDDGYDDGDDDGNGGDDDGDFDLPTPRRGWASLFDERAAGEQHRTPRVLTQTPHILSWALPMDAPRPQGLFMPPVCALRNHGARYLET